MSQILKTLSPKRMRIHQSFFVNGKDHIYVLRLSNGESLGRGGQPANISFYGKRDRISKIFHTILKELELPKDRLNWKRIDEGGMRWDLK